MTEKELRPPAETCTLSHSQFRVPFVSRDANVTQLFQQREMKWVYIIIHNCITHFKNGASHRKPYNNEVTGNAFIRNSLFPVYIILADDHASIIIIFNVERRFPF